MIIDITNNGGGDTGYWINSIVKLLISEPKTYLKNGLVVGGEESTKRIKAKNLVEVPPSVQ